MVGGMEIKCPPILECNDKSNCYILSQSFKVWSFQSKRGELCCRNVTRVFFFFFDVAQLVRIMSQVPLFQDLNRGKFPFCDCMGLFPQKLLLDTGSCWLFNKEEIDNQEELLPEQCSMSNFDKTKV